MEMIWSGLSALFIFSLIMLAGSVFTERTAWFFKEKSKLRGAILWMSVALACAVLVSEFAPGTKAPSAPPQAETNAPPR